MHNSFVVLIVPLPLFQVLNSILIGMLFPNVDAATTLMFQPRRWLYAMLIKTSTVGDWSCIGRLQKHDELGNIAQPMNLYSLGCCFACFSVLRGSCLLSDVSQSQATLVRVAYAASGTIVKAYVWELSLHFHFHSTHYDSPDNLLIVFETHLLTAAGRYAKTAQNDFSEKARSIAKMIHWVDNPPTS